MGTVIGGVHDGLKSIAVDFFHSIRDDLLFPPRPTTFEEFLRSKVKDQYSMIRSRDGKISYLFGQIRVMDRDYRDLQQLLARKDKELETLRRTVRSLEWELREERAANQRRR